MEVPNVATEKELKEVAVHLDWFDEGHPQNSHKRWLTDEIINFTDYACRFLDVFPCLLFPWTKSHACSFIPHLPFKRISQHNIAMSPDILVCSTFISSSILVGDYEAVRFYISKMVKKIKFEFKMILLPVY